jgi:hypothetical protein
VFVPLKLVDAAMTLEIIHPLGYRIHWRRESGGAATRDRDARRKGRSTIALPPQK